MGFDFWACEIKLKWVKKIEPLENSISGKMSRPLKLQWWDFSTVAQNVCEKRRFKVKIRLELNEIKYKESAN